MYYSLGAPLQCAVDVLEDHTNYYIVSASQGHTPSIPTKEIGGRASNECPISHDLGPSGDPEILMQTCPSEGLARTQWVGVSHKLSGQAPAIRVARCKTQSIGLPQSIKFGPTWVEIHPFRLKLGSTESHSLSRPIRHPFLVRQLTRNVMID